MFNKKLLFVTLIISVCVYCQNVYANDTEKQELIKPQCGQYCAYYVCKLLGVPVALKQVCEIMPPKDEGENMLEIAQFLRQAGLNCSGANISFDELIEKKTFPVIAHMVSPVPEENSNDPHFLVVDYADSLTVTVFDGFGLRGVISPETFCKEWDGYILQITKPSEKQKRPDFAASTGSEKPWLNFETLLIDAGDIPQNNEYHSFVFPFRNIGSENLIIKKIKTDCKCTIVEDSYKKIVLPGETGEVSIRYKFGDSRGRFSQSAVVISNDPYFPYIKLDLMGNGIQEVKVAPTKLDFGKVIRGNVALAKCFVTYTGDSLFKIESVETNVPQLKVEANALTPEIMKSLQPRANKIQLSECSNRFILEGQLDTTEMQLGIPLINLTIHTNLKNLPEITVPVDVSIIPTVEVVPSKLFLGELIQGSSINKTITIKSLKAETLMVNEINLNDTGLECQYLSENPSCIKLHFNGPITDPNQIINKEIEVAITVSDSSKPFSIKLPISGIVRKN